MSRRFFALLLLLLPLSTIFAQSDSDDRGYLNIHVRDGKNVCRYKGHVNPSGPNERIYADSWTHEANLIIHIENDDARGKYLPNRCPNIGAVYVWVNEYTNWTLQLHNYHEERLVLQIRNRLANVPKGFTINLEYRNSRGFRAIFPNYYVLDIDLRKVNSYERILGYK